MIPPSTPGLALADVAPRVEQIGIRVLKARRSPIRVWVLAGLRATPVSVWAASPGGVGVDRVALGILSSIRDRLVCSRGFGSEKKK